MHKSTSIFNINDQIELVYDARNTKNMKKTTKVVNETDVFWINQPSILFDDLCTFYPNQTLSKIEQLNSISRLIIYFSIITYIITGRLIFIFTGIIGLIVVIQIYYSMSDDVQQEEAEVEAEAEQYANYENNANYEKIRKINRLPDDYKFIVDSKNTACQAPTVNNPFMNRQLTDITDNPTRLRSCNISNPVIKDKVNTLFKFNLFQNIDDIWDKHNSQRQYYSMPDSQIPNDRESFSKWCFDNGNYGTKENHICKSDVRFDNTGPIPLEILDNINKPIAC